MQAQITITIDPTDAAAVQKAADLFNKLAGEKSNVVTVHFPDADVVTKEKPKAQKVKAAEAKATTTAEATETKEPAGTVAETAPAEQTQAATTSEIKIEDVRTLLSKKVGTHRDAIKAKLTSLGAPNVSTLDPSKFQEFTDYLNSLK